MVHEYALLTIDPGASVEFEAAIPVASEILLSAAGCRSVAFQRSEDRPGTYLLKVGWEAIEDHLERFPQSPQSGQLAAAIGGFFVADPIVAHFAR